MYYTIFIKILPNPKVFQASGMDFLRAKHCIYTAPTLLLNIIQIYDDNCTVNVYNNNIWTLCRFKLMRLVAHWKREESIRKGLEPLADGPAMMEEDSFSIIISGIIIFFGLI